VILPPPDYDYDRLTDLHLQQRIEQRIEE